MDREEKEKAWTAFWKRQQCSSVPAVVSLGKDALSRAQMEVWADFCIYLKHNAKVLDLGTGSGKLPQMLRSTRADLNVVGIDIAEPLPRAPDGIELIGGVSMENLPFENEAFDAAVSQFGFEYGDANLISTEILRVIKPNACIGLMVHRGDGPILAHNLRRQEQILWVKQETCLFTRAVKMIPDDNSLALEAVELAQELADEGLKRFGRGSVAWELAESVRRTLMLGPDGPRDKLLETLTLIEGQTAAELGRIRSLTEACTTADDRLRLLAGFKEKGRKPRKIVPVSVSTDAPFADLIIF
jgi:ubiquinone/menaquinone biosynthesis C-methylase UbiE